MTYFFATAALLGLGGLINLNRLLREKRRDLQGVDPYGIDKPRP
ncbi:hypothetical protein RCO28_34450 [Streptomyces sp. LHD-70]|nr:hypothetical protein [Streptomyces sp. LHD-70]MDQ8707534.1 hypothetical protein [Streptomyces sp. LHD-70]